MARNFFFGMFVLFLLGCNLSSNVEHVEPTKSEEEIIAFRKKLVRAIQARDERALDELFVDGFTHTHASGKVDGKAERIRALLLGEKTIETAITEDLKIKFFGDVTAVATGKGLIEDETKSKYRWTVVYVKINGKWRIAASQATKVLD